DPVFAQRLRREQHVLRARIAAQREDGIVLEQQQRVRDLAPLPPRHQLLLQLEAALIREAAEPAQVERAQRLRGGGGGGQRSAHRAFSSNSCSVCLRWPMKRSASAPSTIR